MNPRDVETAYLRYRKALVAYLSRRLGDVEAASDAAQESYVRVLKVRQPVRYPQAYLYQTAARVTYEQQRRANRDPVVFDSRILGIATDSYHTTADELVDQLDAAQRLGEILDSLPPLYSSVLILKKIHGLSITETARRLGVSPFTVKKYLFRAVTQLRGVDRTAQ